MSTYQERQELQTQYLLARGWTMREGWCAGEETEEWIDVNGDVQYVSVMPNVYDGTNIMRMMLVHEISVERLHTASYRAKTLSGCEGFGTDHTTAVMRALIVHYRKENGIES